MTTDVEASPEQMRMLHGIAKTAASENHEQIRDRAARLFDIESLKELTMSQMRQLIEVYQDMIVPDPAPVTTVRGSFHFGNLPKPVAKKAPPVPAKPKLQSAQIAAAQPVFVRQDDHSNDRPTWVKCGPDGKELPANPPPVVRPTWLKKRPVHNFDPALKIAKGDGLDEIPF